MVKKYTSETLGTNMGKRAFVVNFMQWINKLLVPNDYLHT